METEGDREPYKRVKKPELVEVTRGAEEAPEAREADKSNNESISSDNEYYECYDDPPSEFECGLTGELMTDPVLLPSGEIICRENIRRHLIVSTQNPFNREYLTNDMLKPDDELRTVIALWKTEKRKAAKEEIQKRIMDRNVNHDDTTSEDVDNPDKNKKKHEEKNHSKKLGNYHCVLCEKNFTNTTALNYHRSVKHGEKRKITCDRCKLKFNSYKKYLEHKNSKTDMNIEKNPKCDKCGKRIARKNIKRHHKNVHHQVLLKGRRKPVTLDEPTKSFQCGNCRKTFNREDHLIRHIAEVHIGAEKFSCKYCGKLFKRKQHLNAHILESHSLFFTDFECHICQKSFKQKCHRDRHIQEVHEETNYQCTKCKKTFKQNSGKERHMKEVHEANQNNFKCPNCEKTFVRKFVQARHTKTCV